MVKYKVVYTSKTGNTRQLATAIYQSLGVGKGDIEEWNPSTRWDDAECYLVGFWTDRGNCPAGLRDFLKHLSEKKVLLFGSCGFGASQEYYEKIEANVKAYIPEDAQYLGCYLCQGKMPMSVRERYEEMQKDPKQKKTATMLLENFDKALLHPDQKDLEDGIRFVKNKIGEE